jgi:hypothetical protein
MKQVVTDEQAFMAALKVEDKNEFIQDKNILNMPFKTYIMMSEKHAIKTHIKNLIVTYGLDAIMDGMVGELNETIHE